ncbi:multisubunit Na+/H+ antiporter, MnhE subunit [Thioflavicoccus mobilis 8321]|uniref:Multisubunit Na+/H+ antiporter, MnhE subunit n=1 Tax=Thioflavicoccus mobilis 8321 TaxID=765912 RepID=L0H0I7_9GAMM|nr:Na+/H+ antiporter subunit E [Thioflavicoccus mobilis]AGA91150.1 multisubunit Na+/H+ antiporter, MnhE subunit [Thioflavicoccus mobilis 8321]
MQRLQWGFVLFLIWLGLTGSANIQELLAGVAIAAAIVWLAIPGGDRPGDDRPWSLLQFLAYLPIFIKNLVLANLDVARRVLSPRLPINPGIVRIRTDLKAPYQRLILANSITLTPGTITLEMEGEDMYIHWLDVEDADPQRAGEAIKADMEAAIARI